MENHSKVKFIKLESKEKYQRLLNKDLGSFGIKSGQVILKPGEEIDEHTTGEREEILIILKGKGEAVIEKGKSLEKIEEGGILYIPPKIKHSIKNTSSNILKYIFITSMAQYDFD